MTPIAILRAVSEESGISGEMLLGVRRFPELVVARWVAALLIRRHCGLNKTTIGRHINRDHTTVIHGLRAAERRLGKDRAFTSLYLRTEARIAPSGFAEAAE